MTRRQPSALHRIAPEDDVAVALADLEAGAHTTIDGTPVDITERIPRGHKVALRDIAAGETVRKLGWPIGRTTHDIARGSHVHTHNLATTLSGPSEYRRRAIRGPHRRSPCLYASVRVLAARRRSGAHP